MFDPLLSKAMPAANNVEKVLGATADIGKASGLEAAAGVLEAMADHKRRVVGTGELKAAAASLRKTAAQIRARSKATLGQFGGQAT